MLYCAENGSPSDMFGSLHCFWFSLCQHWAPQIHYIQYIVATFYWRLIFTISKKSAVAFRWTERKESCKSKDKISTGNCLCFVVLLMKTGKTYEGIGTMVVKISKILVLAAAN